jgi:hypothetical protein
MVWSVKRPNCPEVRNVDDDDDDDDEDDDDDDDDHFIALCIMLPITVSAYSYGSCAVYTRLCRSLFTTAIS